MEFKIINTVDLVLDCIIFWTWFVGRQINISPKHLCIRARHCWNDTKLLFFVYYATNAAV